MLASALGWSLMSLCIKLVPRIPSYETFLASSLVVAAASIAVARRRGLSLLGHNRGGLLLRGLLGAVALTCFHYSVQHLPLAEALVIQNAAPLFTSLIAAIALRERPGWLVSFAAAASLLGVIFMTRPSGLFSLTTAEADWVTVLIAATGAVASASAFVVVRHLRRTEHNVIIMLYLPLVAIPVNLPLVVNQFVVPTGSEWLVLLAAGLITFVMQVCQTEGLRRETAARAINLTHAQVVFAALWGVIFLHELPQVSTVIGALTVIAASSATMWSSSRAKHAVQSPQTSTLAWPVQGEPVTLVDDGSYAEDYAYPDALVSENQSLGHEHDILSVDATAVAWSDRVKPRP